MKNIPLGYQIMLLSLTGWAAAQIIKGIIQRIVNGTFSLRQFLESGGMPSSHSACVTSCCISIGMLYGFDSGLFALSALFAMIVMYDACHVRKSSGEQAQIVNALLRSYQKENPNEILMAELKVVMGHTLLQVFFGALLGLAIGFGGVTLLN